jgi:hypothetical protein
LIAQNANTTTKSEIAFAQTYSGFQTQLHQKTQKNKPKQMIDTNPDHFYK